ncbi:hypothetical protein RFI_30292, partial [Reticulomyxa filosa]
TYNEKIESMKNLKGKEYDVEEYRKKFYRDIVNKNKTQPEFETEEEAHAWWRHHQISQETISKWRDRVKHNRPFSSWEEDFQDQFMQQYSTNSLKYKRIKYSFFLLSLGCLLAFFWDFFFSNVDDSHTKSSFSKPYSI